eukprot:755079-Hanusia_phi.AAC.3
MSSNLSSPVKGASSEVAATSSPAAVNPTSSPAVPGTPYSAPRTPGSVAGVPRTPRSNSARRSASVQPSPARSDLGRRGQQIRADAGIDATSENPRTFIWGTK